MCYAAARLVVDSSSTQLKDFTLYISPVVAFNLHLDGTFWLEPYKNKQIYVTPITADRFPYATEAQISRVLGGGSSGHESYAKELRSLFKVPRLVKVSDLLVVPVTCMCNTQFCMHQ